MDEFDMLCKKLQSVPEAEPDEWELDGIAEHEKAMESGEIKEWMEVSEMQKRAKIANGKIALRLPKELHMKAIECAKEQGVSLNTYLIYIISARVAEAEEQKRIHKGEQPLKHKKALA